MIPHVGKTAWRASRTHVSASACIAPLRSAHLPAEIASVMARSPSSRPQPYSTRKGENTKRPRFVRLRDAARFMSGKSLALGREISLSLSLSLSLSAESSLSCSSSLLRIHFERLGLFVSLREPRECGLHGCCSVIFENG